MNQSPLVSIIVACTNNLDITKNCLDSIFSQSYENIEVIFIDNGSEEKIGVILSREYPKLRIIRLENNTGFAGGYNTGMSSAQGKYIAILNNDAILDRNWIASLIVPLESDPSIGSVSSIILNGYQPEIIDSIGVGVYLDGMSRQRDYKKKREYFRDLRETLSCSGCACIYRRDALNKTGMFDEDFFAYCEDTDLGLRLRWAGYTSWIIPGTAAYHFHSMTLGKFSVMKLYLVERNHTWVFIKNFPAPFWLVYPFAVFFRYGFASIYSLLRKGESVRFFDSCSTRKIIETLIRANIDAMRQFRKKYAHRKEIIKNRQTSYYFMIRTVLKYRIPLPELLGR